MAVLLDRVHQELYTNHFLKKNILREGLDNTINKSV